MLAELELWADGRAPFACSRQISPWEVTEAVSKRRWQSPCLGLAPVERWTLKIDQGSI